MNRSRLVASFALTTFVAASLCASAADDDRLARIAAALDAEQEREIAQLTKLIAKKKVELRRGTPGVVYNTRAEKVRAARFTAARIKELESMLAAIKSSKSSPPLPEFTYPLKSGALGTWPYGTVKVLRVIDNESMSIERWFDGGSPDKIYTAQCIVRKVRTAEAANGEQFELPGLFEIVETERGTYIAEPVDLSAVTAYRKAKAKAASGQLKVKGR